MTGKHRWIGPTWGGMNERLPPQSNDGAHNGGVSAHNGGVVLVGGTVVAPLGVVKDGWVATREGMIDSVGRGAAPAGLAHDVSVSGGTWIVPGFVDIHCHGGGGGSFLDGDIDSTRMAAHFHRRNGTTTLLASLISSPHEHLLRSARTLARFARSDETVVGIHVEGPYLSHVQCGAHDLRHLRDPSVPETRELIAAAGGLLRQVTFAPELPGALDMLDLLVSEGVVGAVGHTAASSAEVRVAIERGARLATHLCNCMPGIHHRNGGPVVELVNDDRVFVELINDGVHIEPAVIKLIVKSVGTHRVCMITDAIEAAGQPNGRYKLGGRDIDVVDGVVRLATPEAPLAGSALTMARAFANSVAVTGSIVSAATMCSTTPAQVLGLRDRGAIVRNRRADLVVLSESLEVVEVWQAGERVFHRGDPT